MKKVLVTGSNGFIGKHLCLFLQERGYSVTKVVRIKKESDEIEVGNINNSTEWSQIIPGHYGIVHLAAKTRSKFSLISDQSKNNYCDNVTGTTHLANEAIKYGVSRFVFMSTIGVNGSTTTGMEPFSSLSKETPSGEYAYSKLISEQYLIELKRKKLIYIAIIRAPLVYGSDCFGKFRLLLNLVKLQLPLFWPEIHNKRSLISINNLIDFIHKSLELDEKILDRRSVFFVSDNNDISTTDLVQKISFALNKPIHLIFIPESIVRFLTKSTGTEHIFNNIFGDLQINIQQTMLETGWYPVVTIEEELRKIAENDKIS